MRVLVACEESGRVRDAFAARGHDAVSCDIMPTSAPGQHYQGDVRDILYDGLDLLIGFPPCTYLSSIAAYRWPKVQPEQEAALEFVRLLMFAPIASVAIENPVGRISSAIRKPDQIIHPYMFGDPWVKRTCLWLKNLPKLVPQNEVEPTGYWVDGGKRGKDETSYGGKFKAAKQREGAAVKGMSREQQRIERSKTFPGVAAAMADQWGKRLAASSQELAA